MAFAILPVDFAYSGDGKRMAIVSAGNANAFDNRGPQVQVYSTASFTFLPAAPPPGSSNGASAPPPTDCMFPGQGPPPEELVEFRQPVGETTAIDFDGQGRVIVQTREPARIEILTNRGGTIKLSDESRFDSGHAVFHVATGAGLACAACHPEGGDDGRVWRFAKIGARRTQNLRGGIGQSAPFHWDGDMRDLSHLMGEVFTQRMAGPPIPAAHVTALGNWMGLLPALPTTPGDAAAIARGQTLFNDTKVACATCHGGALFTNNRPCWWAPASPSRCRR
jgi:YD repeat-containing protein